MTDRQNDTQKLRDLLLRIKEVDKQPEVDYDLRYRLVVLAVGLAASIGFDTGYRIDPDEGDGGKNWLVAVIHLPTGQVSWHFATDKVKWDNHDTEEKYRRTDVFCKQ